MKKIKDMFDNCEHKWLKGIATVIIVVTGLHFGLPPEVAISATLGA